MTDPFSWLSAGSTAAVLSFGFLIGLKHATEADHLAAVSTIVTQQKGILRSAGIGAVWGLGHTVSLFAAGILVLLLDFSISPAVEKTLEFAVGVMLAILGLNVLRKLLRGGELHIHEHSHGGHSHLHLHSHPHQHDAGHSPSRFSPKALIVGMVHGLAGSAALMLMVIPIIDSKLVGLLYIILFGIGSIAGMAIMTFLVGLPFQVARVRSQRFVQVLQATAGAVSLGLGLWIAYSNIFHE